LISLWQASIPISGLPAGFYLREAGTFSRLFRSLVPAAGIIEIVVAR
jgi:hypothetical protein